MVALAKTEAFVPPERTNPARSKQIHRGVLTGKGASTMGNGSFTCYLEDLVQDPVVVNKNQDLWFHYWNDQYATPYLAVLGTLGIARTAPVADEIQAACTITPIQDTVERSA